MPHFANKSIVWPVGRCALTYNEWVQSTKSCLMMNKKEIFISISLHCTRFEMGYVNMIINLRNLQTYEGYTINALIDKAPRGTSE